MNIIFMVLGMALVTYLPKALPAIMLEKMKFNPIVNKYLRIVPYTAMASLIFPGIIKIDPNMWYISGIGGTVAAILAFTGRLPLSLVIIAAVLTNIILYSIV